MIHKRAIKSYFNTLTKLTHLTEFDLNVAYDKKMMFFGNKFIT